MRLTNESRYPTAEVEALVAFGAAGVGMDDVAVLVRDSRAAYQGTAYGGMPPRKYWKFWYGSRYLITLHVGAPERFPANNLVTKYLWRTISSADLADGIHEGRISTHDVRYRRSRSRSRGNYIEHRVKRIAPYGGPRSPLIEMADWREALVAVAAHEAHHIWQFRTRVRCVEADCEQVAALRLDDYRRSALAPAAAGAAKEAA